MDINSSIINAITDLCEYLRFFEIRIETKHCFSTPWVRSVSPSVSDNFLELDGNGFPVSEFKYIYIRRPDSHSSFTAQDYEQLVDRFASCSLFDFHFDERFRTIEISIKSWHESHFI